MKLVGAGQQVVQHFAYDASGVIAAGGTAQLLLPQHPSRSMLMFVNYSTGNLYLEFGAARATCSLSGTVLSSSFTITNSGFGYTRAPTIDFLGGGYPLVTLASGQPAGFNTSYVGAAGPGFPSPSRPARAHATLSGSSVNAIVLDDPGAGYAVAPLLFMINSDLDPIGCATPSASSGILVTPGGGGITFNGTCCPTDAISVFGATTSQAFTCKYMT